MAGKDIVRNYDWTSVPRGSGLREEAPKIIATAHKLESNQLQQFIGGYINTIEFDDAPGGADAGIAFYKGLYKGGKKLGTYHFPFFTDDYRSFSNEYADSFSPISQRGATMIGAEVIENLAGAGEKLIGGGIALGKGLLSVGSGLVDAVGGMGGKNEEGTANADPDSGGFMKGLQTAKNSVQSSMQGTKSVGAPGTFIETPKFYQYANTDQGLNVSFALSNTLADDGAKMNADFIKEFTEINRPYRQGSLGMEFPAIYHIEVPGLRYIEWASLDNLGFSLLGQRRNMGGVIVPEAYIVTMSFTSLTIEAANFMKMVQTPGQSTAEYKQARATALGELRTIAGEPKTMNFETERGQIQNVRGGTPEDAAAVLKKRGEMRMRMDSNRTRLLGR
tara:strand:+ start:352 stop:1524 length:1173 start_codon:yes stop_codon:yes gene_type:complete